MKIKRLKYIDSARIPDQDSVICKPLEIDIVGFVIEETDEYITLAGEIMEHGDFRCQTCIPKVAIIKK